MFFNLKKLFIGLMIGFGMFTTNASAVLYDSTSCNNGSTVLYLNGQIDQNVYINGCSVVIQDGTNIRGGLWVYASSTITIPNGANVNILDNVITDGDMNLGNATVNIGGYLRQGGSGALVAGGTLNIAGNYDIISEAELYMRDDSAHITVDGNFTLTANSYRSDLYAGTLEVKGDFTRVPGANYQNFEPWGTHKVLLSGNGPQTVNLNLPSDTVYIPYTYFNVLEVNNTSMEGVDFVGAIAIKSDLITTTSNIYNLLLTGSNLTLMHDITIDGGLEVPSGRIYLGSNHTVTINGDVLLGESDGTSELYLDSSTLNIGGDLNQTGYSRIYTKTGKLNVQGNYDISANSSYLSMVNDSAYVRVNGNFTSSGGFQNYGLAGTLEVKGDFTTLGDYAFCPRETHKVLLSGNGPQTVNFSWLSFDWPCFNVLEVNNTSIEGVTFVSEINIDGTLITTTSNLYNLRLKHTYLTLQSDITIDGGLEFNNSTISLGSGNTVTINGDVLLNGSTLNLNSSTLNINGDLNQTAGSSSSGSTSSGLHIETGTLNVQGNYDISGNSLLSMINDSAYVTVDGNFTMASDDYDQQNSLTAGTLEVKGDFSQIYLDDYYSMWNFKSSGTHKVILSGDTTQTVSFDYPTTVDNTYYGSAFNILEVANTSNEGVIFVTSVLVKDSITANSCTVPLVLDNVTYGTLSLEGTCTELSLATKNKTKYFLDSTGDTGVRTYADDYTYTGSITLSDGTVVDVSGMYEIVDNTLTLTRESPAPATLVFTYLGKNAGVMNFNGSIDNGAPFQSHVYDTKEERDAAMPKKVNPALIMYLLN